MSKNVICVLDKVATFIEGFSRYVQEQTDDTIIVLKTLEEIYQQTYDVLLVDKDLVDQIPYPDKRLYTLGMDVEDGQVNSISRFQQPQIIYQQLMTEMSAKANDTKVVSLFSMAGGTGKTTFAKALYDGLQRMGKSVFFLSLSIEKVEKADMDLSLLLYYFHQGQKIPDTIVEKLQSLGEAGGGKCVLNTPEDNIYMTEEVVDKLLQWLKEMNGFSYLLVELPWAYDLRLAKVLRQSTYKLIIGDHRHSPAYLSEWRHRYQTLIQQDKGFYMIANKTSVGKDYEDVYCIPVMDMHKGYREMKEWINKYLLTHWMKL